jgi:hypothetical protein
VGIIMREFVDSQIIAKRAIVEDFQRKLLAAQAELRAYEEMRGHLDDAPLKAKINGAAAVVAERSSAIPTEMTPGWRTVLCKVGDGGRTFGAGNVAAAAADAGVPAKMTNARSQIYQWQTKHIVTRVRKGKYRLTPKGQELIHKNEGPDAQTPEPS